MHSDNTRSVLIVEDERIVAKDLQQTLADLGYDAYAIAASADEAVSRASERCPDLVLMDIRIKGRRDGIDTAAILRDRFGIPVVYLTAHADDATIERAKKTEPYGYLLKPVKAAELRSAVEVSLYKHEMEKRLRERERRFSTTLKSIADAVITVDLAGNVTFMNPAAEQLAGMKFDDAIGRHAREVVRSLAAADAASSLDQALTTQNVVGVHGGALEQANGKSRLISDSAAPIVDDGQVRGAVLVFRDITEQKLLQGQRELLDRLASLATMAAGVAHHVNNPLAVVVANASIVHEAMARLLAELRSGSAPDDATMSRLEETLQAQSEAQSAAARIGRVVADLKAFSRPAAQAPGAADVGRAIKWAIRSTELEFHGRGIVASDVSHVPPVAIDEPRLGQVLVNLLINASQALTPGHPDRNQVSLSARAMEGDRVVVEVRDSGCGMTPEVLGRIFEPFFTTRPVGAGTGLGLSICHGIATSVGGDLKVESHVGRGSVFRLVLPVAVKEGALAAAPSAGAPVAARLGRILIIEDEDLVRRAIGRALKEHETISASSAREALKLLDSGMKFDVILSDLMMPGMTGMEFYETLLETRPDDARRVVFLSGGTINEGEDFLASVPNLRLEKPFDVAGLKAVVQQVLAKS